MIIIQNDVFTRIEISEDLAVEYEETKYTYLHCTYRPDRKYKSGWFVNASLDSYLINPEFPERLRIIDAIGVLVSPAKHFFSCVNEYLNFTLIFPAVPKDWKTFDFIEDSVTHFNPVTKILTCPLLVKNIHRNDSGVYRIVIN